MAYYSLPYLIWNQSLSLDGWRLSMNFDTVAWKCSSLAALMITRCCAPICLMGQVQMGKYQMQMKHTMIYPRPIYYSYSGITLRILTEADFQKATFIVFTASHFCSLCPHSLVASRPWGKKRHLHLKLSKIEEYWCSGFWRLDNEEMGEGNVTSIYWTSSF